MQRRHKCSPAASFANCLMTPYLLKVHLQTFLSISVTQKCQILSCDTLVANGRYDLHHTTSDSVYLRFFHFIHMILGKWPTWRTISCIYLFIYISNSLHVSSTSCSSSEETNGVNTTSGSCHSVSVAVSCAGRKWTHIWPAHVTATGTEWQLPEVVLTPFVSPDDEHDVLETCRELEI